MRITDVELIVLADPAPSEGAGGFARPSPTAYGVRINELPIVRIHTDAGVSGLSEVFSVPAGVARAVLHGSESFLGRHLIGEDPFPPERLWARLYNSVINSNRRGWQLICIGALDVALWDLCGKALGRPVWQLLGGAERVGHQLSTPADVQRQVMPYCTIISRAWDRESVLSDQIDFLQQAKAHGFRAFKIEPMRSTPETIVELVRRARRTLDPDDILAVDVGYLWNDVGTAIRVLRNLEEYDIAFLETPFPVEAFEAYARLAAQTPIRLAAGEHSVSRWEFLDFMDRGRLGVVQPYMVTVGGLTEARRVLELALPRGVSVIPGNWSTQLQGAAAVQFAVMSPVSPLVEYAPAALYDTPLRRGVEELALPVRNGLIAPPDRAGNGLDLPEDLIRHFRIG